MKCTREKTRAGRTSTPRTDARSTSTCPTTTANAHNPSIPPIGGEGRLHDSAGPPIFPSSDRVRGAGVEPASQAWKAGVIPLDYPRAAGGTRPRILESFLRSRFRPAGAFLEKCLEFVNRREEIVYILALVFQIPRDPSGVWDRLFREPLARFLPEFRRLLPFHSLACHRAIPSDDCQPEFMLRVLSPIVTTHRALTNCRLSTARALGDIYKSSTFHVGHLSDAALN